MTTGAEGNIHLWDYKCRTKIKPIESGGRVPICTAKISHDGRLIAYGTGNDWHMGRDGMRKWLSGVKVHFITE